MGQTMDSGTDAHDVALVLEGRTYSFYEIRPGSRPYKRMPGYFFMLIPNSKVST